MFPTVRPLAPWEATSLLTNTGIAANFPNEAKLDRLTYLEAVVANLLLPGQPATRGLAALPSAKPVAVTPAERRVDRRWQLEPRDLTGAHLVCCIYGPDTANELRAFTATLQTPWPQELVSAVPNVVPGDMWLVLLTNALNMSLRLETPKGDEVCELPVGTSQLMSVSVATMTKVLYVPLLAGMRTANLVASE